MLNNIHTSFFSRNTHILSSESTPKKISPSIENLLKEFDDIFPKERLVRLPPFRGIKHETDLVPRASLPNRSAYKINPQETKEIESQV